MSTLARLAAAAVAIASAGAMAGGEMGGADEHPDEGLIFFGYVKDARGAPISGAKVTATMKSGNTFIVQTSATGLYRLPTFSYQINPAEVVIACAKEGYKQTRVIRRPIAKANPPKPVETECRMERG
ncbi:MAG TPA: carboxypeptidase-like regulatory domain-containing protein [Burkholderiales bacterium]